jgi:hypothetical protein
MRDPFKADIRPDKWMDWIRITEEQFGTVLRLSSMGESLHLTARTAMELKAVIDEWLTLPMPMQ